MKVTILLIEPLPAEIRRGLKGCSLTFKYADNKDETTSPLNECSDDCTFRASDFCNTFFRSKLLENCFKDYTIIQMYDYYQRAYSPIFESETGKDFIKKDNSVATDQEKISDVETLSDALAIRPVAIHEITTADFKSFERLKREAKLFQMEHPSVLIEVKKVQWSHSL